MWNPPKVDTEGKRRICRRIFSKYLRRVVPPRGTPEETRVSFNFYPTSIQNPFIARFFVDPRHEFLFILFPFFFFLKHSTSLNSIYLPNLNFKKFNFFLSHRFVMRIRLEKLQKQSCVMSGKTVANDDVGDVVM